MQRESSETGSTHTLSTPSRFWTHLGAEHVRDLDAFGPEHMKRRQALRYFTWRFSIFLWPLDSQVRFLLAHTPLRIWPQVLREPMNLSDAAWAMLPWPRRERWLYVVLVRLLWEYAARHDPLGVSRLSEPNLGDPLPVRWHGSLISQDLANSVLEVAAISRALGDHRPRQILEVGGGYGRTAYVLLHAYPSSVYTIVDIEPALSLSRWYLSLLFPADRLRFLTPDEATTLPARSFELALSISSLQEMTPAQVTGYLKLIDRVAAGGTVFLKQWRVWTNPADRVQLRFASYPIPSHWRPIFSEPAPVQTRFMQAIWRLA